ADAPPPRGRTGTGARGTLRGGQGASWAGPSGLYRSHGQINQHLPGFTHACTSRPGEESLLADQAITEGFDLIVAVGGDGTWSNVADRIVASGKDNVALGILASGTGNDFGRNFGMSIRNPELAVQTLANGVVRSVDVGRVVTGATPLRAEAGPLGTLKGRHFLNLVGFGFDIAVIEDALGARFLRGELLYKLTALKNLFSYPGVPLVLESDGPTVDGDQLMLTISNAPFFGGGYLIAPAAELGDAASHHIVEQLAAARHVLSDFAILGAEGLDQADVDQRLGQAVATGNEVDDRGVGGAAGRR
ncbi:MAG: hypothetical protein IIA03_05970, partial [Proteobacteria bacterium]|nr:hypothetical protein [Pseudomonadota bacterium]